MAAPKLTVFDVFSRTETFLAKAVAISNLPSPLKSLAAIETSLRPKIGIVKLLRLPNLPVPSPNKTETSLPSPVVAKSILPSALKSPASTERGRFATVNLVELPKLPVPSPKKTEISLSLLLLAARSSLPSPLKSAVTTV